MLQTTYEGTKGLLKADPSVSKQEQIRILKLIRQGGETTPQSKSQEPLRLLRRKEAAERLSISLRTLDLWAAEGLLTKVKLPGRSRACGFSSAEIDHLVKGGIDGDDQLKSQS